MLPSSRSGGATPTHTLCAYAYFGCCARAGELTLRHVFRSAVTPSAASLSKWMLHGFLLCKSESCSGGEHGRFFLRVGPSSVPKPGRFNVLLTRKQHKIPYSSACCHPPLFFRQYPDSPVNSKLLNILLVHYRIKKLESVSRHNRTLSLASCSILALDTFRVHYTVTYSGGYITI